MSIINIPATERVVFVCEKRHQSLLTARAWAHARPHDPPPTWFISINALLAGERALPRDIPISSLPRIAEPHLTRASLPHLSAHRMEAGELVRAAENADDLLRTADHVICACDQDVRGAGMFRDLIRTRLGADPIERAFLTHFPSSLGAEDAVRGLHESGTTLDAGYQHAARVAETRRFFDHNWALNAIPLLGAAYRAAGGEGNAFISKYALLLLYALRRFGPRTESDILMMMTRWRGSGKYGGERPAHDVFGSASSRYDIIQGLRERGLVGRLLAAEGPDATTWRTGLTGTGHGFLSRLHPDCHDPDLGFRLWGWGGRWPASRPAAERYLRTFFGRQKRFRGGAGSSRIVGSGHP